MSRPLTWLGPADAAAPDARPSEPAISLADVNEIELLILRRMREFAVGEHPTVFHGSGFDFTGLREWQAGDRLEQIDWPQSSLTSFSPLIVREYEQRSTSNVVIVADASASTRAMVDGVAMSTVIARAIATIGMSAVFLQDAVGLIPIGSGLTPRMYLPPRIGKNQVMQCLEAYTRAGLQQDRDSGTIVEALAGFIRRPSLVAVISDFLFDDARTVVGELAVLNNRHDVLLALVDAAGAFDLPIVPAGWVSVRDVETGRRRVISRRAARALSAQVRAWQDQVMQDARGHGLDIVRLEVDPRRFDLALAELVIARRFRRKTA